MNTSVCENTNLQSAKLTNEIFLGIERAVPGQKLFIVERKKFFGKLFLYLRGTQPAPKPHQFQLWWLVTADGAQYCMLAPPQWIADDQPVISNMVLRLVDPGTLIVIDDAELERVCDGCLAVSGTPHVEADAAAACFGDFEEVRV